MSQTITDAIAELYRISAMTPPTQQERVVVLNELLAACRGEADCQEWYTSEHE